MPDSPGGEQAVTADPIAANPVELNPIEEVREAAREQISAAWQLHLEKVQDVLQSGWRESVDHILDERVAEMHAIFSADAAKLAAEAGASARREMAEAMGLAVRRLRQFESEAQWCMALLDAAIGFCSRAALFHAGSAAFRFLADRGPVTHGDRPNAEFPASAAPAMQGALESADTIVTIRVASELSQPVIDYFGEDESQRVYLFPVATSERIVAVLYAEPGDRLADLSALEMLATVAGSLLEGHLATAESRRPSNVVAISSAPPLPVALPAPPPLASRVPAHSWAALTHDEQDLHLKAQRFARVKVAEMRLYKSAAVRSGRVARNLFDSLHAEIEGGREEYSEQFLAESPTMLDYFHVELVRTLANDDPSLLGPDYPGPLV
ncbi:MAG: hypothetical protein ABI823_00130 [Bryobacteraceae bacterium]